MLKLPIPNFKKLLKKKEKEAEPIKKAEEQKTEQEKKCSKRRSYPRSKRKKNIA